MRALFFFFVEKKTLFFDLEKNTTHSFLHVFSSKNTQQKRKQTGPHLGPRDGGARAVPACRAERRQQGRGEGEQARRRRGRRGGGGRRGGRRTRKSFRDDSGCDDSSGVDGRGRQRRVRAAGPRPRRLLAPLRHGPGRGELRRVDHGLRSPRVQEATRGRRRRRRRKRRRRKEERRLCAAPSLDAADPGR